MATGGHVTKEEVERAIKEQDQERHMQTNHHQIENEIHSNGKIEETTEKSI